MFLANFSFVALHLIKIQPAVHLNTLKAHCSQKEKFIKNLPLSVIPMFQLVLKKIRW